MNKKKPWFPLAFIIVSLFTSLLTVGQPAQVSANGITFNPNDVQTRWQQYKNNYISTHKAGPWPRQRVYGGITDTTTVSEGQAYGMLFAATFDEQPLFDGLWLFAADHLDNDGFMNYYIGGYQSVIGAGGATDADLDMAMALLMACAKVNRGDWNASTYGLDYCALAQTLIDAIFAYEVDLPNKDPSQPEFMRDNLGYELVPGNLFTPRVDYPQDGITNLSYFSPAYMRLFQEFTGNPNWQKVIDRNYQIAEAVQAQPGNCGGLVHNWSNYAGEPEELAGYVGIEDAWGYDAARYAWRVAMDVAWHTDAKAIEQMNLLGGFWSSVGINNVKGEYWMSGYPQEPDGFPVPLFVSNAAVSIWAAPNPTVTGCGAATPNLKTTPQQAYDAVINANYPENYFNDSWVLLVLLLMQGQFEQPDVRYFGQPLLLTAVTPGNSTGDVDPNANLHLTFSEDVTAVSGHIIISEVGGGEVERIDVASGQVLVQGTNVIVNPNTLLGFGTDYEITIEAETFQNVAGTFYEGLGAN